MQFRPGYPWRPLNRHSRICQHRNRWSLSQWSIVWIYVRCHGRPWDTSAEGVLWGLPVINPYLSISSLNLAWPLTQLLLPLVFCICRLINPLVRYQYWEAKILLTWSFHGLPSLISLVKLHVRWPSLWPSRGTKRTDSYCTRTFFSGDCRGKGKTELHPFVCSVTHSFNALLSSSIKKVVQSDGSGLAIAFLRLSLMIPNHWVGCTIPAVELYFVAFCVFI